MELIYLYNFRVMGDLNLGYKNFICGDMKDYLLL